MLFCISPALKATAQTDKEKIELGVQKFKDHERVEAYKLLAPLSNSKYFTADAEYCMGDFYKEGVYPYFDYTKWDYEIAMKWFKKSANDGNSDAMAEVGILIGRKAENKNKLNKEELKWYKKAVANGSGLGQAIMGSIYSTGQYVPQDYVEALKLHRLSANQGNEDGILCLARDFELGIITPKDLKEASRLYYSLIIKSINGNFNSYRLGARAKLENLILTSWPTKLLEDRQEILFGIVNCKYSYDFGNEYGDNYKESFAILTKNIDSPFMTDTAFNWLGFMYDQGKGTQVNYTEAFKYFKKAAELGYPKAQFNVATYYFNGKATTKNNAEAYKWYLKSALQGYEIGQFFAGYCLKYGIGVKTDEVESVNWLRKSAIQGNYVAQYLLGLAFRDGRGVAKDNVESQKWIGFAAKNGYYLAAELCDASRDITRTANAKAAFIPNTYKKIEKADGTYDETTHSYYKVCTMCSGYGRIYQTLPNGGNQFIDKIGNNSTLYGTYDLCAECRGTGYPGLK